VITACVARAVRIHGCGPRSAPPLGSSRQFRHRYQKTRPCSLGGRGGRRGGFTAGKASSLGIAVLLRCAHNPPGADVFAYVPDGAASSVPARPLVSMNWSLALHLQCERPPTAVLAVRMLFSHSSRQGRRLRPMACAAVR
jgi:hypothetical protein